MQLSPRTIGASGATLTAVIWGGQFIVARSAFPHLSPVWMTALRYLLAGALLLTLLLVREPGALRDVRRDPRAGRVLAYGVVGFAGFNLLAFVGLQHSNPEPASLIVSTMPLLTGFVLWAKLGRRPSRVTWVVAAVALVGVGTVLTDGHLDRLVTGGLGWGEGLVLLGATCWVVYTTGAAEVPEWSPLRYTAVSAASGGLAALAVAVVLTMTGVLSAPGAGDVAAAWWQLAYLVVPGALVAVLSWNAAARTLGAQDVSLFINLVPVTTFAVEAVRGQAPHPAEVAGALLTVAALFAGNLLGRRRPAAPTAPAEPAVERRVPAGTMTA
ncbi:drug/metabolite transporter (DMT)-like permease [Motilibacter peucedani]|uniref:Drug/metabolite transporter (DMT)-like permease n=1 Tax=Motilibacter peucedani TaxID=598650 RepID=A0A420XL92_9ACTN|nr:DMT family transporter [Motilibacter peucedani]RKS69198.1 drug/metabolite transporter (DMT)-like permease [Motilibacter peucedani]